MSAATIMSLSTHGTTSEDTDTSHRSHHDHVVLTRSLAIQALALSVQEWHALGQGEDPSVASLDGTTTLPELGERIVSLLMARIVCVVRATTTTASSSRKSTTTTTTPPLWSSLATSVLCRAALMEEASWLDDEVLTPVVVEQLRLWVKRVLKKTQQPPSFSSSDPQHGHTKLPFHNAQRVYHVVVSANKLLDLVLTQTTKPCFGLRQDALSWLALLLAALIKSCCHQGVTNQRLLQAASAAAVTGDNDDDYCNQPENHQLALLYNDHSMQEQASLQWAFTELLQPDYAELRRACFATDGDYRMVRATVIQLALSCDLASPERTQIRKSKWQEAFGGELQKQRQAFRRSSMVSDISMPRATASAKMNRRGSNCSISSVMSDVTIDSHMQRQQVRTLGAHNARYMRRRLSNQSMDDSLDDYANDSVVLMQQQQHTKSSRMARMRRRASNESNYSDYAADSVAQMLQQQNSGTARPVDRTRSSSTDSSDIDDDEIVPASVHTRASERTLETVTADSIALAQRRGEGYSMTRRQHYTAGENNHDGSPHNDNMPRWNDNYDNDEDDSLSLTPPSSEDEFDGVVISGVTLSRSLDNNERQLSSSSPPPPPPNMASSATLPHGRGIQPTSSFDAHERPASSSLLRPSPQHHRRMPRRASTGNVPVKFGPLTGQRIDEETASDGDPNNSFVNHANGGAGGGGSFGVGEQRSTDTASTTKRLRLGIRRSMDFSGESIEVYARSSMGNVSTFSDHNDGTNNAREEVDELKAAVVLEILLRTADVSHGLQSWDNFMHWTSKLFMELARAHSLHRGHDPRPGWFDNQIRVLECYLQPLATQLNDTGVLAEHGWRLSRNVEDIHKRWLVEGFELTKSLIEESDGKYQVQAPQGPHGA